ncbi:hypothetical protein ACFFNY_08415 [Paenibacillus hodogayensis]|uniref:Alpha-galactosidase n=1 Tax=Paenibacillus hodogayensis TaxID=279208 RepID=A0ABV5VTH4_9BACL
MSGLLGTCHAQLNDGILTVGNAYLERKWTLSPSGVFPLSLLDRSRQTEWLDPKAVSFSRSFSHPDEAPLTNYTISQHRDDELGQAPEHLLVIVSATSGSLDVRWQLRVYPHLPVIRQSVFYRRSDRPYAGMAGDVAVEAGTKTPAVNLPQDCLEYLPLAPLHCHWQAAALHDVTDTNNNLVTITDGLFYTDGSLHPVAGNVLTLQNRLTKDGLLLIKESPTRLGQLEAERGDFCISGRRLWATGSGVAQPLPDHQEWVECYGTSIGVFHGEELERLRLIRGYHDSLHLGKPERDAFLMSNTWGDRSRDSRVTESFIMQELAQASRLDITHVQIDDGWQRGITSNSVLPGGSWADYYSVDAGFWDVHPERFPRGLGPVVERAKELNISIGLWFSPDSTDDFMHWRKDADMLIRLWNDYRVNSFKLDGIVISSKTGEARFLHMLDEVRRNTSDDLYFNLDTTSGKRQGYLYHTSGSCLFLENRYTDFKNYYPHWTLRNLWMLSPYVPAGRLQLEFLNTDRNAELYGNDPLSPNACGIAYAFAVTLFANPLAWMELSGLTERQVETLRPLFGLFNGIKRETNAGHVLPIGEEPSGTGWTGLQCMTGERSGYALVFRELTNEGVGTFRLWGERSVPLTLECMVRSEGRDIVHYPTNEATRFPAPQAGRIEIALHQPLSFALYRYAWTGGN